MPMRSAAMAHALAADGGYERIVRLLLTRGADIEIPRPREMRPLHVACYRKDAD